MLEIKNLDKGYNGGLVIRGINLKVNKGEIHGLIGDNGAGKTTLLKCVAGIYRPAAGEVLFDGEPVYDQPTVKEKIAYVSEQLEFSRFYSVRELAKYYKIFYDSFSMDRWMELAERFSLNQRKTVSALSKGQRAKLYFALALAIQPQYLIMDEPESGMDTESKEIFRELLIDEVDKNQTAVLFSSHDLKDLERLCDSVSMMEEGEIIVSQSIDQLMESVQKWSGVIPEQITKNHLLEKRVYPGAAIGNLTELFTVGDKAENAKRLEELGIQDCVAKQISLEEIYLTLKKEAQKKA